MSPEQFQGDGAIGPRADIYALGHIAYALLTGRPYWADEQRSNPAIVAFYLLVMTGPPELPTARAARRGIALPGAFDAWFARATARVPSARFERASMLVTELAAVLGISTPRFSMASVSTLAPESPVSHKEALAEALSSAPTKQILKVDDGVGTVVDPAPLQGLERSGAITASDLTSGATAKNPLSKPSRPRGAVLVPASVLLIGIGLMMLVRSLQGGFKANEPGGHLEDKLPVAADAASSTAGLPAPSNSVAASPVSAVPPAIVELPASVASATPSAPPIQSATAFKPASQAVVTAAPKPPALTKPPVYPKSDDSDNPYSNSKPAGPPKSPELKVVPKSDCVPPYTVDSQGHKHMNLDCP